MTSLDEQNAMVDDTRRIDLVLQGLRKAEQHIAAIHLAAGERGCPARRPRQLRPQYSLRVDDVRLPFKSGCAPLPAAFAMQIKDKYKFSSDNADPYQTVKGWLLYYLSLTRGMD